MKSLRISVALIVVMTAATIMGCGNSGSPSEPSASTAVVQPGIPFASPNGQKKVGPYVWLWQSKVLQGNKLVKIKAGCPANYVVVGGGYGASNGYGRVFYSFPNAAFNGWVITAAGGYHPAVVTVFASCAPAK